MASGPLDGIRILEWAIHLNGPAAGYILGDLGAEVIKIEHPVEGDTSRGIATMSGAPLYLPGGRTVPYETANRSKKGITLNLQTQKGKEILFRLVAKCDVFFTNFRESVGKRLGLDYDTLIQYNPRLIYAINTGWGTRGPDADKRGFDQLAQARSGLMWAAGDRDDPEPVIIQGAVSDTMGATMFAFSIVSALLARERRGIGQKVETSLFGSSLHLQAVNVNTTLWQGRSVPRHSRSRSRNPLENQYRCADGRWLRFAESQSDRFWKEFCQALSLPGVADDPRFANQEARRQHFQELNPILEQTLASRTASEWLRHFNEKGYRFARAPVNTMEDAVIDPQTIANDYVVECDHPTMGRTKTIGFPMKFHRTPAAIQSPPPEFGQHTEEVLMELGGYSWEEIAQFREQGII